MIEEKTGAMGWTRVRYQLGNPLGTVALEVDDDGEIISYEAYHPYGTTAWKAPKEVLAEFNRAKKEYPNDLTHKDRRAVLADFHDLQTRPIEDLTSKNRRFAYFQIMSRPDAFGREDTAIVHEIGGHWARTKETNGSPISMFSVTGLPLEEGIGEYWAQKIMGMHYQPMVGESPAIAAYGDWKLVFESMMSKMESNYTDIQSRMIGALYGGSSSDALYVTQAIDSTFNDRMRLIPKEYRVGTPQQTLIYLSAISLYDPNAIIYAKILFGVFQ